MQPSCFVPPPGPFCCFSLGVKGFPLKSTNQKKRCYCFAYGHWASEPIFMEVGCKSTYDPLSKSHKGVQDCKKAVGSHRVPPPPQRSLLRSSPLGRLALAHPSWAARVQRTLVQPMWRVVAQWLSAHPGCCWETFYIFALVV